MLKCHRAASTAGLAVLASLAITVAAWSASVEITARSKAPFGNYLTDGNGRTVYMFTADTKDKSACIGACTTPWPPVLTSGAPTTGSGTQASALGTIKRGNEEQVTYDGMPLYYFIRDKAMGSTAGEGITHFGGSWYVVSPAGKGILPTGKELAAAKTR
ncbi:MAG: COG4315 family predicted lipoprotein [Acetobacteraceae bacterium]